MTGQYTFPPTALAQDKIFFTALLTSNAAVSVTVGGVPLNAGWEHTPDGGAGLYHGHSMFGNNVGPVVVTVGGLTVTGKPITANCPNGIINWNAWVGYTQGGPVGAVQPATPEGCIAGTGTYSDLESCRDSVEHGASKAMLTFAGLGGFQELCEFSVRMSWTLFRTHTNKCKV